MRDLHLLTLITAALLVALIPTPAFAAAFRQDGNVVIGANEVINDDLYVFGGTVDVQGTVDGDVVAAGGTVTMNGVTTGDVIATGGTVNLTGEVRDSVRVAGGTVLIHGPVRADVLVGAGSVHLGPRARVGRDLVAAAGSVTIGGEVGRNVRAGSNELILSAPVHGNVWAEVETLRLTDNAVIDGSLRYRSEREAAIATGATVRGAVERQRLPTVRTDRGPLDPIVSWLRTLFGLLLLGLLFIMLFPGFSRRTTSTLRGAPWASLGLGFVLLLAVPIGSLVLFVVGLVIGGWWLALILLALYATTLLLGIVTTGLFLGGWVLDRVRWSRSNLVWALLLGLLLLTVAGLVPWIGGLIVVLAALFGLGALALAFVQARRGPVLSAA
jgi:cytoskeletal protein CcmA (bactofilin family)